MGGIPLPKLNMTINPIANKYRVGKVKSTQKRELNLDLEIVNIGSKRYCSYLFKGGLKSLIEFAWP